MKKSEIRKLIIACLITLSILFSLLAVCFSVNKTFSASVRVVVPEGKEVSVYVSGNNVKKDADGKSYTVPKNGTITVTVVNESELFAGMKINGNAYDVPVVTLTVPNSGELNIEVTSSQPFAEDKGRYFGNPYVLSKEEDVLAVARILAGKGTAEDYIRLGETEQTASKIRYGYYRLGTNIFMSSDEFFGLGFRGGQPFSGCFDFNGFSVTLNMTRTKTVYDEFASIASGTNRIADYGFFAYVYGDGNSPCLIRQADVRGFIGLNTVGTPAETNHEKRINAGGIAGTLGKNVVLDGIKSSVSVGVRTNDASQYIGGMFGICSSSVDRWCYAEYDGMFNDISGITFGAGARVNAGCFAGVLENASVDGFTVSGQRAIVLANALGDISGSAISGGFVGSVSLGNPSLSEISAPRSMVIRNVNIIATKDYSVNAVIDNKGSVSKTAINPDNPMSNSAAAVAGGIIGTVNRSKDVADESYTILFSDIYFSRAIGGAVQGEDRLAVNAATKDGSSSGAVYAGGAVGFIFSEGAGYISIERKAETRQDEIQYLFADAVDVKAVQNGIGPAYAGGMFGYNCFNTGDIDGGGNKRAIVSAGYDYTVTAVQSASSSTVDSNGKNCLYNVCAGGYTSRLPIGYEEKDFEFHIGNGRIRAYREVGSTAVGDINAGGFAGRALSTSAAVFSINGYDSSPAQNGKIDNLKVYYSDYSYVEAAGYSFSSIDNRLQSELGNNICVGGAIGYVLGYTSIKDVSVDYAKAVGSTGKSTPHFVYGVQNAKNISNRDADLKSEGFVGGAFGLVADSILANISITGDSRENSVVYFESSNTPNTASVGGLIGALWTRKLADKVLLSGAKTEYIHVAGKAYSDKQTGDDTYDIYVGGAIGVFANPTHSPNAARKTYIEHITVKNSVIESIGENKMLTYAGGIVAGMWWHNGTYLSYAVVVNSAVTASSITAKAYAGGITGLLQNSYINNSLVQKTDVKAVSESNIATSAGIASRVKGSYNVSRSYSNASLESSGGEGSYKAGIHYASKSQVTTGDKNFFVSETAGTDKAYVASGNANYAGEDCALHLVSYGVNKLTIDTVDGKAQVYPALATYNYPVPIWSSDQSVVSITSGSSTPYYAEAKKEGVAYVSAYCTIENTDYLLCSYPVTVVNAGETGDFSLDIIDDKNMAVNEANCDRTGTVTSPEGVQYKYYRRHAGNPDTVGKFTVKPGTQAYMPQNVRFYDVTGLAPAEYGDDIAARISAITARKPSNAVEVSAFNGRVNVGFNYVDDGNNRDVKKSVYMYVNDNVRENTIIVMECDYANTTYGVIFEFVPNKLTKIEIQPDEGTPCLDSYTDADGNAHYMYVGGDIVRFNETLFYYYPAPRSYVVETIYEGQNVTENGTVNVTGSGSFPVTCRDLKGNLFTTAYIEVVREVDYSVSLAGATASFDRKMVIGSKFGIRIAPQPGYSLVPEISVTVGAQTVVGVPGESSYSFAFEHATYLFDIVCDVSEQYAYNVEVPADFISFASENGGVHFSVSYRKIYSLVFMSNYGSDEFYSFEVAAGEKFADINTDDFQLWKKQIIDNRYGFDFQGFYPINRAGDISSYGKSFEDMRADGVSCVNGTMRFYARWTYNVIVRTPGNIAFSSTFSSSMLQNGSLVPLDDRNGFGFVMKPGQKWAGKPRFDAFTKNIDGTFTNITRLFVPASQENGYFVSAEKMADKSGFIYIVVYADNLEFNVGDGVFYDGNKLYTDGIFTLTYNVNYGKNDLKNDVKFLLSEALPAKTSLRLFYVREGATVWSGGYTLGSAKSEIAISSFASMKDNLPLSSEKRKGATSEKFILVVTLPNNSNHFAGITSATAVTASVGAYEYNAITVHNGDLAALATDKPMENLPADEKEFTLYPAVILSVINNGNTFNVIKTGERDPDVTDYRHKGVYYMWRVEKTAGGYIGDVVFGGFGKEVVRTTDAIYYAAAAGVCNVTGDLSGYTVSLIETRNIQQPAEALIIYKQEF